MKSPQHDEMLAITRLTRRGRLGEATAAIRRLLSPHHTADSLTEAAASGGVRHRAGHLPEVLRSLFRRPAEPSDAPVAPAAKPPVTQSATAEPAVAEAAVIRPGVSRTGQFLSRDFSNAAGSRPYKLYVPGSYMAKPVPLVIMLHGCTQSPDDFAAGTRMNSEAEAGGFLVAYPGQTIAANSQKCWNWFNRADQARDAGEPALIAGITCEVMRDYAVRPSHVFVAGLSAGGAAADVMGALYPDLYAAIGVHSGLACGAAHDLASAFAAMQNGSAGQAQQDSHSLPTIVFHGDRDTVVNPRNGQAVVARALQGGTLRIRSEDGHVPGGHAYRRLCHVDPQGRTLVEQWVVIGGGHAWSGGDPAGSFTDPRGPDATREMLRFFFSHAGQMS